MSQGNLEFHNDSANKKIKSMKAERDQQRERILVIEDEAVMLRAVSDCLARRGYRVLTARDGAVGLEMAQREKPDLIVLDVMMPILDGWSLCSSLRGWGIQTPVLFLSAKGSADDRVRGLNLGGDDYLSKPFSRDELLARVRALLRRAGGGTAAKRPGRIILGNVTVDLLMRAATLGKRPLALTPKEFGALELLALRPGEVVERETFLDRVWGVGAFPTTRTVDRHVASLRQKIEPQTSCPRYILTVHGIGYRLSDEVWVDEASA